MTAKRAMEFDHTARERARGGGLMTTDEAEAQFETTPAHGTTAKKSVRLGRIIIAIVLFLLGALVGQAVAGGKESSADPVATKTATSIVTALVTVTATATQTQTVTVTATAPAPGAPQLQAGEQASAAAPAPVAQATTQPAVNNQDVYYKNCTAARAAGAAPIRSGQPGYRSGLDGDKDGIACE